MEKIVLKGSMAAKKASCVSYIYYYYAYIIIIVYRVNLNKLSRTFVGAIRTTTTNCMVSFIDFYLVFPRNFRIVFQPHTYTVILLEPCCGIITEPGIPVIIDGKS